MKKIKAFTLIEMILVIILISVGVMSIIYYIQNTLTQVQQANQKIIAMNLAKEGIESVYYARNSRILAHSGCDLIDDNSGGEVGCSAIDFKSTSNRSRCWLSLDSRTCDETSDAILDSGNYVVNLVGDTSAKEIVFTKINNDINLSSDDILNAGNMAYAMYLTGDQWITKSEAEDIGINTEDNLTRYGRFFRKIEGKGVFLKKSDGTNEELTCGSDINCFNNSPKEFRFCSVVKYLDPKINEGELTLCGIITNFFPNTNQEG